jgi:hypothetical protein
LIRRAVPTSPGEVREVEAAVITLAASPAAGMVRLEFAAEHATSFQVWRKGPADAQFTPAAATPEAFFEPAGLAAGTHESKVAGVNSRGEGPASGVASVSVAAVAVA